MRKFVVCGVMAALLVGCASDGAPAKPEVEVAATLDTVSAEADAFIAQIHITPKTADEVTATCDQYLAKSEDLLARLEGETGTATVQTLRLYDALANVAGSGSRDAGIVSAMHPDKAVRDAAEACDQRLSDFDTKVGLSRPVYDRLAAIDQGKLDAKTVFVLKRTLANYRRAGVDRDEATRARVMALQNEITATGIAFDRNIREGRKEITATPAELEGLPADYIANHKPGPDGMVRITTDTPDYVPVMSYAKSEALRRRLYMAYQTRAWPQNDALLLTLLKKRSELAKTVGFDTWARLVTENKMIQTPERAAAFIEEISVASKTASDRDYGKLLARYRQIEPAATKLPIWNNSYVTQLVRKEQYAVNPQEVRQYFAYNNVRDGVFRLTQDLFGIEIRRSTTPVWHESVEAYDAFENGKLIGRFFLDMHPRDGKYNHAAHFYARPGLTGRSVPIGILVCNFPAGDHATGLMEHRDVETFLHEFGHLLHGMFSGKQDWSLQAYNTVEWDFIEAPSQLLEEWVWDYDTLKTFAVNAKGETIPLELVNKMRAARSFAEALGDRTQLGYSAVSLNYHSRPPETIDLAALYKEQFERYSAFEYVPGTYQYASFGHLNGYSAIYYTYTWSRAISADLFSEFEKNGLHDKATAQRYRRLVLEPGGSAPAGTLVQNFLGRPSNLEAYKRDLAKGN